MRHPLFQSLRVGRESGECNIMKKQPKPPSYAAVREANANHFCDGLNDDSYLSMRFRFAEDAVRKATEDAAVCMTSLARLPVNNRGDTVSTVAGELFSHLERIDRYRYNYDERLSEALYYWIYFTRQFVRPFLEKKQSASTKLGKSDTADKFGHIIGQLSNMAGTMRKTIKVCQQAPKTYKFSEKNETFTYFYPQVPIAQFRKRGEELFLEEELATKELFSDAPTVSKKAKKHTRECPLTPRQITDNAKKNELIVEIRRRAKEKFGTRGAKGIQAAYDEISAEAQQAGSKWLSIIGLVPEDTILNMARHNRKYKTA